MVWWLLVWNIDASPPALVYWPWKPLNALLTFQACFWQNFNVLDLDLQKIWPAVNCSEFWPGLIGDFNEDLLWFLSLWNYTLYYYSFYFYIKEHTHKKLNVKVCFLLNLSEWGSNFYLVHFFASALCTVVVVCLIWFNKQHLFSKHRVYCKIILELFVCIDFLIT